MNVRASARRILRDVPVSTLLIGLGVLGLLTILMAFLQAWAWAITGLVLLHLGTLVLWLGAGGVPAPSSRASGAGAVGVASTAGRATGGRAAGQSAAGSRGGAGDRTSQDEQVDLVELQQRVDSWGAKLLASSERTRVELSDALARSSEAAAETEHR